VFLRQWYDLNELVCHLISFWKFLMA